MHLKHVIMFCLGLDKLTIHHLGDSSAARGILQRQGAGGRVKHIEGRLLWSQQKIQEKIVVLNVVQTRWNLSDMAAKALSAGRIKMLKGLLGYRNEDNESIGAEGLGLGLNTKGQPRAPEDMCSLRHHFANVIRDSLSWHMQELNWKVYVRALAGCGTLVVLSVSRLPCLERRAPGNRTEDKAATWVKCRTCAGKVRADIHKDVQRPYICTVGSSWGNRAILPGSQPPMTSIGRCTESADWGRGLPLPCVITERNLEALGVKQCTKPWGGGGNLVPADARVRSAKKSSIFWEFCLSAFCHASLVFGVAPCVCQMNNSDALDFGPLRVLMH